MRIDFRPEATAQQRADAQAVVDAFDWSQSAHDAWLLQQLRTKALAALDSRRDEAWNVLRAVVIELLDYANKTRAEHNRLLTWLGTQTTLVNRPELNNFALTQATPAQARTAIKNRVANGEGDAQ